MKVSIITTCYNREKSIAQAIESVLAQNYRDIEYIIVDGASSDNSMGVIDGYRDRVTKIISEKDSGMYEAINKGLKVATGDIIGLLHSDDFLINNHIISDIVEVFGHSNAEIVYGNGLFVDAANTDKVIRDWRSGAYRRWKVRLGWLPLHPTVYIKREVIERCGLYDESYKIAADSDFLVRYMYKEKLKIKYFDKYILKMRMGGNSTDSRRRKEMWNEDVRMFKGHGFWGVHEKLMKMCWKVPQFVNAKLKKNLGNG